VIDEAGIDAVNLKYALRKIKTDGGNLHGGGSSLWRHTTTTNLGTRCRSAGAVHPIISWQITPRVLTEALAAGGAEAKRAFVAMMDMKKIDVAAIEAARRGVPTINVPAG